MELLCRYYKDVYHRFGQNSPKALLMNPGISHQGFSTPNLNEYRVKQLVGCVVQVSLNIKSFNLTVGLASGPEAVWCLGL